MIIHSKYFSPDTRALYQIDGLISKDVYVYTNITKIMYGLKKASIIAYKQRISHMDPHGYHPVPFTTGLWSHQTIKTVCPCVDDFSVKYFRKDDADHLLGLLNYHLT